MSGTGNPNAKLVLIGECPGFNEDLDGHPFVGESGKLLDFILNKLGISRSDLWITNLIKCHPNKNELPKGEELKQVVEACMKHLRPELSQVHPKVVVLLGGTVTHWLSGHRLITKVEGTEVELTRFEPENQKQLTLWKIYGPKFKAVACYHPAYVLRSPSKEPNLARSIAKAAKMAGMKIKPKGYDTTGIYEYEVRT
jgi:DNA polymerase